MAGVKSQLEMLQHALHMANLYLGSGEIVVPIRDGERAGDDVPITIRQRVLFMDEECAMLDSDGIDAYKVEMFDEYIQKPELLQLLLPEEKGVVVLRVARHPRKYEGVDPFTQIALNEENAKTYWLVRNGDALWRFWADFDAPNKIFPDRIQEVSFNKPGSAEYYREMEAEANASRLSYMKAGLLVQGIIDRTLVFAPFPNEGRPVLTDPDSWNDHISFVYDSEPALGEGRPPFSEWLREVNKRLIPGQRIITNGQLSKKLDEDEFRVSPKEAFGYNENCVWTVENDKRGLFFRFPRTDYAGSGGRRGTYLLFEGENNYINFDAAPIEDFEYYFRSREARVEYREMVSVLQRCLELRQAEDEREAPFRELLRNILIRESGDESRVERELGNLIRWWKTKVKNFRPLVGSDEDNRKALADIVAEFHRGGKQDIDISEVPISHENLVLVVQKNPKTVVAYFSAHIDYPMFFHEQTWAKKRTGWTLAEEREWVPMPAGARAHPRQLFAIRDKWERSPVKNATFVAKPILDEFAKTPFEQHSFVFGERAQQWEKAGVVPLAVAAIFEYGKMHVVLIADRRGSDLGAYEMQYARGQWSVGYGAGGLACVVSDTIVKRDLLPGEELLDPWRKVYIAAAAAPEVQRAYRERLSQKEQAADARKRRAGFVRQCVDALHSALSDAWRDEQYRAYIFQGGDVSLFEDHLRTIKVPAFDTDSLDTVLSELLVLGNWEIDAVVALDAETLYTAAKTLNSARKKSFGERNTFPAKLDLPAGFKLPSETKKVEKT